MRAPALQIRRTALAAAAVVVAACSRAPDDALRVRTLSPGQGDEGTAVAIRIEGDGLEPHVLTDYGDEGASLVDARFRAWLGAARLRDVRPSGDGALLATVPEDLPAGTYELAVEDPAGNRGTLAAAYRVLAPTDAGVRVASFRFDPVAGATARAPFTVRVAAVDAAGQVVTGFSGTATLADRSGALVPVSIGPFAWGVWAGPVEVRAAHPADALTASDGLGHAGTSNEFAVLPAPAARVTFASPPVDATAGACAGPVTVALEDLYGAPTAALAPVDVAVAGGAATIHADPACAVPAGGATIPAGATSAAVYVRATLAAPFTLDATSSGLDPGAQRGLVRPAAPSRLVFTSAAQTLSAGACSAAAAIGAEDAYGNVAPVAADTAVALSSSAAAGLTFHGAAGCGAPAVAGITLPAGGAAATFWFRATAAEAVTLTAAGDAIPSPGTQGETIVAAAPVGLAFVTPSQAVPAGSCSGLATVEARDAFGNPAAVTVATAVALAAAPAASFSFHLDPACGDAPAGAASLAAGTSRASFRFRATATGPYDVTATGAGLPGAAAQTETVGPAAPDRVVFTTAPRTSRAGQCSGPLAVEIRDGLGNPAPVAASTSVALAASPSAGTQLFATPDCSGPAGGPATVVPGAAAATFSFRSTAAGPLDVTATVAGLVPGTQAETVLPAAPDRLVFTSAPLTAAAGSCSAAATVEARDPYGNVAPVAALTPVALSAAPGAAFAFHGSAGCAGAPVASVDLAAGTSTATFWFSGTAAGSVTVTATGAGMATSATQGETIVPAAPDRLAFTSASQTVVAGVCSGAATFEARDAYGNVAPVASLTSVSLGAAPGSGFAFYGSAGCGGAAVASVDLAAGATGGTFWFRGTVAGPVTVTAAGAGIPIAAAQPETIGPAAPERLVFTTAPQTVSAGSCSVIATVESLDAYGNVAPVTAPTAVALSASPAAGLAFHDAAGCGGAAVTSVALAAGASTASFTFRGTVAGAVTVTASATGFPGSAAQGEVIAPSAPDRLVFATAPQTATAGACSGAATVTVLDTLGNVAPVGALTPIALSASPAAGFGFYGAAGCLGPPVTSVDLAAGASNATFWFRGTAAGGVTVDAAAAGIPVAASQLETIDPAAPASVVFASDPQVVVAGACSGTARLELRDAFGNPTADAGAAVALALSATPAAGFEWFEDPGCAVAVGGAGIAIPAGSGGKDFWFRGTLAGDVTVSSAPAGLAGASQVERVRPAAPDRLVFATAAQTATAGACSGATIVEARDPYGNLAPVAALTPVSLVASPGAGFQLFATAGCGGGAATSVDLAPGASSATFWFEGTAAGTVAVAATAAGIATGATQDERVVAAAPDRLLFTSAPQTLAAGACSGLASIEARDAYGNLAPVAAPTAVSLSAAPSTGFDFHDAAGCGGAPVASLGLAAGASSATFRFRGTAAGSVTITAMGAGIATAATQLETVEPAAPDRLVFTSPPQTVTAGLCSGLATVEARDPFGNPAPVAALTSVSLSAAPASGFAFFGAGGCGGGALTSVDLAAGASTATFRFSGTWAGTVSITAAAGGIAGPASQDQTVVPAGPDRLVFTSPPQTVVAGACSGVATIEARDAYGNVAPVAALTAVALDALPPSGFQLFDAAGCGGAALSSVGLAAGASTASFRFRGTVAGAVDVRATGAGIPATAQQGETVDPAAPAAVVFASDPQTVTAGACSGATRVELRDAFGNATADPGAPTALNLTASPAAGLELFEDPGCAVAVPGASIRIAAGVGGKDFWFKGTLAGTVALDAAPAGLVPASQAETIAPAAPVAVAFSSAPVTAAAGACSALVTLVALDPWGNVAPVPAATPVPLSAAPVGSLAFHDASGCGGAAVSSTSFAAGASTATFRFLGTTAATVTVTASAFSGSAAQAETIAAAPADRLVFTSAPQTVVAGACSSAATLEARDAFGNVATVASSTPVALSASPSTGVVLYAAAGCAGLPVSSVALAAGASGTTFWFTGGTAGPVTITAAGAGIAGAATQVETVIPGTPDRLGFTTAPQTLAAGACSDPATVALEDAGGNTAPVASATAVSLAASPPTGVTFYAGAGCAGAPVSAITLPAGGSSATFSFRIAAAGNVTLTATGAGVPGAADQVEVVQSAAWAGLAFDWIPSPQKQAAAFAITIRAVDAYGNPSSAFTGTAVLAPTSAKYKLTCASGCTGSTTTAFVAGVWSGTVSVTPHGTGVQLTATAGAVVGTSNPFDILPSTAGTPPIAVGSVSPVVLVAGQAASFDASQASDAQTSMSQLQVSWDFTGAATGAPGGAGWTAWSGTRLASNVYAFPGTYQPRLAVLDTDGMISVYALGTVVVVAAAADRCVVTAATMADDGALSCAGPYGADGALSLAEALRVSGGRPITFASAMTITGAGSLAVSVPASVHAARTNTGAPTVLLDLSTAIDVSASVLLAGIELRDPLGAAASLFVEPGGALVLEDAYVHDTSRIQFAGRVTVRRSRLHACVGPCLEQWAPTGTLAVEGSLLSGGDDDGIRFTQCGAGSALDVSSTVITGLVTGVRATCVQTGTTRLRNLTFHANGTGVAYDGGGRAHDLRNAIFSGQTGAAVTCGTVQPYQFYARSYHLLFGNAADGCIASDPYVVTADPLYVAPASLDFRISEGSMARDAGLDTGTDVNGAAPGNFSGGNPDRGGRETW